MHRAEDEENKEKEQSDHPPPAWAPTRPACVHAQVSERASEALILQIFLLPPPSPKTEEWLYVWYVENYFFP